MSGCVANKCIQLECEKRKNKPDLRFNYPCVVQAGVYENVTVEINERCQVVRLEPSEKIIIKGCDSCA